MGAVADARRAAATSRATKRAALAWEEAAPIADEDVAMCEAIGEHGLKIIREASPRRRTGKTLNILTHCNAGWLATVDWGTALAPIYMAHDAGIPLHVWVDETRPRNQGASLTAFELGGHGVPHTIIADNAGGHYMQAGQVDLVHRRHRPRHRQWRCRQQDRHLSEGAGGEGQRRAVLCRAAVSSTIDWTLANPAATFPSRNARPTKC